MSFFRRIFNPWEELVTKDEVERLKREDRDFPTISTNILRIVNRGGFSKRILLVAASGFFTDSYSIFSTNVVNPALAYVYWPGPAYSDRSFGINAATLVGSCVGMLLFGFLADKLGRSKLYGVELVIVIFATLGLTQVSQGYDNKSMHIYPWIIFWRLVLGIGVGAEYPLSALIAAEYTSTEWRATMLAMVFCTQPLAQLTALGAGVGALRMYAQQGGLDRIEKSHSIAAPIMDKVWRLVVGAGCVPAFLAIMFRLSIPESPRFLLSKEDPVAAAKSARELYPATGSEVELFENGKASKHTEQQTSHESATNHASQTDKSNVVMPGSTIVGSSGHVKEYYATAGPSGTTSPPPKPSTSKPPSSSETTAPANPEIGGTTKPPNSVNKTASGDGEKTRTDTDRSKDSDKIGPLPTDGYWKRIHYSWKEWRQFLAEHQRGRILLGTSICWALLDIGVYGLGLDNPAIMRNIWSSNVTDAMGTFDITDSTPIFLKLEESYKHSLYTTAPAGVSGCLLILLFINHVPRVSFMALTFCLLAGVFLVLGASYFSVAGTPEHTLTVVLYAVVLFLLNLGPNTLIFILPAELFETRYRGTCYGIAAASGKAGALFIQGMLRIGKLKNLEKTPFGILLVLFIPIMLLGALSAWVWIPEVQEPPGLRVAIRELREHLQLRIKGKKMSKSDQHTFGWFLRYQNRSLEEISEDPVNRQHLGLRRGLSKLLHLRVTTSQSGQDTTEKLDLEAIADTTIAEMAAAVKAEEEAAAARRDGDDAKDRMAPEQPSGGTEKVRYE